MMHFKVCQLGLCSSRSHRTTKKVILDQYHSLLASVTRIVEFDCEVGEIQCNFAP